MKKLPLNHYDDKPMFNVLRKMYDPNKPQHIPLTSIVRSMR